MRLDPQTVFMLTSIVAAMLGALLVFSWLQSRATPALLWWGSAFIFTGTGIALISARGFIPDPLSLGVGLTLPMAHCGLMWTGMRVFDGRPVRPYAMLAGALLYMVAFQFETFAASPLARVGLSALIVTTYSWLSAFELWRGRGEALISRWPAIIVLFGHGAVSLTRIALTVTDPVGAAPGDMNAWQWVPEIARLIYIIAGAFVLLAMAKERSELGQRNAASIDSLTQIANRRAFTEGATRRLRRAARDGTPVAVMIADLDHFKRVNDRFGHAVGDRVLRLFADTAVNCLRPEDLVGRLGGEEFVAILPGASADGAMAAAERVRAAFAAAAAEVETLPVGGSVSIGIASARAGACDLDQLVARADGALYLAKARGRNRVENAGDGAAPALAPTAAQRGGKPMLVLVEPGEVPIVAADAPVAPVGKPLTH